MSTPHEVTDACVDAHCHSHDVDEPTTGWLMCGECLHMYPSARALRRDYRREFWRVSGDDRIGRLPLWRRLWRVATVRTSQITFCQHCIHDFVWMPPRRRRWFRRAGDAA